MNPDGNHVCVFRARKRAGLWSNIGPYRERTIEHVGICAVCGKERRSNFRKILQVEKETASPLKFADPAIRRLAKILDTRFQTRDAIRAEPLIRRLGGVHAESDLERLALQGGIRLVYRPRIGSLHLSAIRAIDRTVLAEIAEPGAAERRKSALERARKSVATLEHPQAQMIAEILYADAARRLDEACIHALAALARISEDGEALPARVFSAKFLGHSKALARIRHRLERLVGPLERIGIRDSGQVVIVGGKGHLRFCNAEIDLSNFHYLGLAASDATRIEEVRFPRGGLLIVENLTPFQTCVDQLAQKQDVMVLWSAGFPGQGVLEIVRRAAKSNVRVRVWCDLDLGGVRIARILMRTASNAEPLLMNPELLRDASTKCSLAPEQAAAIRREISRDSTGALSEILQAMLDLNAWVEQETLLDQIQYVL